MTAFKLILNTSKLALDGVVLLLQSLMLIFNKLLLILVHLYSPFTFLQNQKKKVGNASIVNNIYKHSDRLVYSNTLDIPLSHRHEFPSLFLP